MSCRAVLCMGISRCDKCDYTVRRMLWLCMWSACLCHAAVYLALPFIFYFRSPPSFPPGPPHYSPSAQASNVLLTSCGSREGGVAAKVADAGMKHFLAVSGD